MSRSGYVDDLDNWDMIKWRGRVASATRGKRGQRLFLDLLAALDAMPEKRLITAELETTEGVCALGAVGKAREMDMSQIDPGEPEDVAAAFDIAACLAQEVVYMNDEYFGRDTPEQRWVKMRAWVEKQLTPSLSASQPLGNDDAGPT